MELHELVSKIEDKADLIKFISELKYDFVTNKTSWENQTLESYFDAMQAWLEDFEGWEKNCHHDISKMSTWQFLGQILYASKIYE